MDSDNIAYLWTILITANKNMGLVCKENSPRDVSFTGQKHDYVW